MQWAAAFEQAGDTRISVRRFVQASLPSTMSPEKQEATTWMSPSLNTRGPPEWPRAERKQAQRFDRSEELAQFLFAIALWIEEDLVGSRDVTSESDTVSLWWFGSPLSGSSFRSAQGDLAINYGNSYKSHHDQSLMTVSTCLSDDSSMEV